MRTRQTLPRAQKRNTPRSPRKNPATRKSAPQLPPAKRQPRKNTPSQQPAPQLPPATSQPPSPSPFQRIFLILAQLILILITLYVITHALAIAPAEQDALFRDKLFDTLNIFFFSIPLIHFRS